jgi:hypothetical protein
MITATDSGTPALVGTTNFTLNVANVAPMALVQSISTPEETPKVITLVATDPGADMVTYEIVSEPPVGQGTLSALSGAQVTFTPAAGFVGSTSFSFRATDSDGEMGNVAMVTVNVLDSTPPVIALLGANPVFVPLGGTFVDPGATATDNSDGDLTAQIIVTGGPVVTSEPGNFTLTYNVSDLAGNAAVPATRTVVVVKLVTPVLQIQKIYNSTNGNYDARIIFDTVLGLQYSLYTSSDLAAWTLLTPNPTLGDGFGIEMIHEGGGSELPRFYVVKVKVVGQ